MKNKQVFALDLSSIIGKSYHDGVQATLRHHQDFARSTLRIRVDTYHVATLNLTPRGESDPTPGMSGSSNSCFLSLNRTLLSSCHQPERACVASSRSGSKEVSPAASPSGLSVRARGELLSWSLSQRQGEGHEPLWSAFE